MNTRLFLYMLISILLFVLIFSFVILIHEFGHFYAAKKSGVKVEEFGLGLPPKIYSKQVGETLYSLNAIPFGGFVRLFGEDASALNKKNPRSFQSKSFGKKVAIISGGVVMNFILAWLLLTLSFAMGLKPILMNYEDVYQALSNEELHVQLGASPEASDKKEEFYLSRLQYQAYEGALFSDVLKTGDVVLEVNGKDIFREEDLQSVLDKGGPYELVVLSSNGEMNRFANVEVPFRGPLVMNLDPEGVAKASGVLAGDIILAVNGEKVRQAQDFIALLNARPENLVELELLRADEVVTLSVERKAGEPKVGVELIDALNSEPLFSFYPRYAMHHVEAWTPEKRNILEAMGHSVSEMIRIAKATASMFFSVILGFVQAEKVPEGVAGPVGMFQMVHMSFLQGWGELLRFVALLSLSLGVINILPFPALDGGRLLFVCLQAMFSSHWIEKLESRIHYAGFLFLMVFLVYITFNDVLRLI